MQPELVEGLTKVGFDEYLVSCPECHLEGMTMARGRIRSGEAVCPRCGAEINMIKAPRIVNHRLRLSNRLAFISALLVGGADVMIITHSIRNATASLSLVALHLAWFLLFIAWTSKP